VICCYSKEGTNKCRLLSNWNT